MSVYIMKIIYSMSHAFEDYSTESQEFFACDIIKKILYHQKFVSSLKNINTVPNL